jgi:hypothetical protein
MIVEADNGNEMLYNDERNVENARRDVRIKCLHNPITD